MTLRPLEHGALAPRSRRAIAPVLFSAILALPLPAAAHEVLHTIERGRAVAVRAYHEDGAGLAHGEYQVFAPSDARAPHQAGRTDRNGWLAFVPDAPGTWIVKVADGTGHGVALSVEVSPEGAVESHGGHTHGGAGTVLRPLAGVLVVGALFAALLTLYRRKAPSR